MSKFILSVAVLLLGLFYCSDACLLGYELSRTESHLVAEEGLRLVMYDAKPGAAYDPTICVGFSFLRSDARSTFQSVLPGVNYNAVSRGQQSLTEAQCLALFRNDLNNIYIPRARSKVGSSTFCRLPTNVKIAVINAIYRGDMGPRTAQLIREGDWCNVADEYLDHQGYRTCHSRGLPGICRRMDWNAAQFRSMC